MCLQSMILAVYIETQCVISRISKYTLISNIGNKYRMTPIFTLNQCLYKKMFFFILFSMLKKQNSIIPIMNLSDKLQRRETCFCSLLFFNYNSNILLALFLSAGHI